MSRSLIAAILMTSAGVAGVPAVAAGSPAIAYVKVGGSSQDIDLVNPDGSGLTRVYTSARKASIGWLDLKPGGGEVAFTENFKIKIQRFSETGQPTGAPVPIPSPCNAWSPDYHPSGDGTLIFVSGCSAGNMTVMQYSPVTNQSTPLFTVFIVNRVRWSRTGAYVIYDQTDSPTALVERLKRRDMTTGAVQDFGELGDLDSFDINRVGEQLVYGPAAAPKLFDFDTMTDTSQAAAICVSGGGEDFHFSPDGADFIYKTPHNAKGDYILIRHSDCSSNVTTLAAKGSWGRKDWRP
jgi:hypothetical protein